MKLQNFEKSFKRDSVLFREGDPGREMYIIRKGKVVIKKRVGGNEHILAVFSAGEFFGEMAALTDKPRSADAVILENAKLLVIDPETFEKVIPNNPEIALKIMRGLAGRIMEANGIIEGLLLKSDFAKIVHFLLRFKDLGTNDKIPTLELTVQTLSKEKNIELSRVREVITQLERADIIRYKGKAIDIINPEKLRHYMSFLLQLEGEE